MDFDDTPDEARWRARNMQAPHDVSGTAESEGRAREDVDETWERR